ncbi:MAG: hypothetical protein QXF26_06895, partial [Candidatus Bathyarchaeia archaeon]
MEAHRTQEIILNGSKISNFLFTEPEVYKGIIPSSLLRLSDLSLSSISGKTVESGDYFSCYLHDEEPPPEERIMEIRCHDEARYIRLRPSMTKKTVAAVDVSSIRLGATEQGVLCSLRASLVWREGGGYQYLRFGPLIFHVTDEFTRLSAVDKCGPHVFLSPSFSANPRALVRLRNVLERSIQRAACSLFENALVLVDGSLTAGTPDNPTSLLIQ